ncbi:MAG: glycosyltransferase family 39 protein [Planctomycetaceae bacterium]|nr:glycosyltransferase family 39 protein [Planctomycetaceae bacterium]
MRSVTWCLIGLLMTALGLRLAVVQQLLPQLAEDRDGYIALANSIVEGRGYSSAETGRPTAYRPPLYPLLVAALKVFPDGSWPLGVAQALLGTATVWLTWRLGRPLVGAWPGLFAAGLVAVDPLLLLYTAQAMTETLFTFLAAALLTVTRTKDPASWTVRRQWAVGVLLGLAGLCRPTVWAWPVLVVVWRLSIAWRSRGWHGSLELLSRTWRIAIAAMVVVLPWLVRNIAVLGSPVATTTHGGYTLLLANNPVVYREEVQQPWGVTWEDAPAGRRQSDWYAEVLREKDADLGAGADEIASDRWMAARARRHIRDEPLTFLRAMGLRVRRLWNVAPLGAAASAYPPWIRTVVGAWYSLLFLAAFAGSLRVARSVRDTARSEGQDNTSDPEGGSRWWAPLFLLLVSVTLVHSVYWSNARMRAPLMPAVCVLAAAAFRRPPA